MSTVDLLRTTGGSSTELGQHTPDRRRTRETIGQRTFVDEDKALQEQAAQAEAGILARRRARQEARNLRIQERLQAAQLDEESIHKTVLAQQAEAAPADIAAVLSQPVQVTAPSPPRRESEHLSPVKADTASHAEPRKPSVHEDPLLQAVASTTGSDTQMQNLGERLRQLQIRHRESLLLVSRLENYKVTVAFEMSKLKDSYEEMEEEKTELQCLVRRLKDSIRSECRDKEIAQERSAEIQAENEALHAKVAELEEAAEAETNKEEAAAPAMSSEDKERMEELREEVISLKVKARGLDEVERKVADLTSELSQKDKMIEAAELALKDERVEKSIAEQHLKRLKESAMSAPATPDFASQAETQRLQASLKRYKDLYHASEEAEEKARCDLRKERKKARELEEQNQDLQIVTQAIDKKYQALKARRHMRSSLSQPPAADGSMLDARKE